jgi:hypothetical protein
MTMAKRILRTIVVLSLLLLSTYSQPSCLKKSLICCLTSCYVCLGQSCPESCCARCCVATMVCCCGRECRACCTNCCRGTMSCVQECRDWCRFNVRNPIRECCAKLSCPQMQRNSPTEYATDYAASYAPRSHTPAQQAPAQHQPVVMQSMSSTLQTAPPTFSSVALQEQAVPTSAAQSALTQLQAQTPQVVQQTLAPAAVSVPATVLVEFAIPAVSGARRGEE